MEAIFEFLNEKYYRNTLENWLISFGIIIVSIFLARATYWLLGTIVKSFTSRTKTNLDDLVVDKLEKPAVMLIISLGIRYGLERLHFAEGIDAFIHRGFIIVVAINVTWFIVRTVEAFIENYLIPYSKKDDNTLDDQMVLLIERGMRIILWSLGFIVALNNAGFDVGALIAGLGIGGLALALAAQDTVKNIFGGIMIFIDRPFRIGDRVVIGSYDGFVEYIGIRSTRLRTLAGRMVTIPNAQFTDHPIENITIEPARRIDLALGLTYDTPPERIELAMNILREISKESNSIIHDDQTRIMFSSFGAYSLDIKMIYYIQKGKDIFDVQTIINGTVLKRFNENNLEFAFPTQTLYKKQA